MKHPESNEKSTPTVVLFSYMRPELTAQAIIKLQEWESLNRLIVTIDGLRDSATTSEISWRNQTIEVSRDLARQFKNIEVLVWDINTGLTSHAIRAFDRAFLYSNNVISTEEDVEISEEGLNFLGQHSSSLEVPQIASSFSKFSHPTKHSDYKVTVFPEQWGTAFNKLFYEEFLLVAKGATVQREKIKRAMDEVFGLNSRLSLKATNFWFSLYQRAQNDLNHGDALMSYTAISCEIKYRVPWQSLSKDIAGFDSRGMHKRRKEKKYPLHRNDFSKIESEEICLRCELINSQIDVNFERTIIIFLSQVKRVFKKFFF